MAIVLSTPLHNDDEKGGYYIDFAQKIAQYVNYPDDQFDEANNGTIRFIKPEHIPEVIRNDVIGNSVFEGLSGKENYRESNIYFALTKVFDFVKNGDLIFINVKSLNELYKSIEETEEEIKTLDKQFVEDIIAHSLFCVDSVGHVQSDVYDHYITEQYHDWRISKSREPVFDGSSISHLAERSRIITVDYMGMVKDLRAFIQLAHKLIRHLKETF